MATPMGRVTLLEVDPHLVHRSEEPAHLVVVSSERLLVAEGQGGLAHHTHHHVQDPEGDDVGGGEEDVQPTKLALWYARARRPSGLPSPDFN